jgi:uncharacterized protein (TIGR02301 family)
MRSASALALAAALLAATPATAQTPRPRTTEQQQSYDQQVDELANTIGGAHYLRILCQGRGEQMWRDMMRRLLDLEGKPGTPRRAAMVEQFNAGYRAQEEQFPDCSATAQATSKEVAARGKRLADGLAARYRVQ